MRASYRFRYNHKQTYRRELESKHSLVTELSTHVHLVRIGRAWVILLVRLEGGMNREHLVDCGYDRQIG